ncbi:unnamed protein product [Dovyalis caffra]|uniref:Uncharacterized protein n=1 Tax=Dovyalis caffra TaxID=77055 RepID=A0AAV1SFC3_9ROSI|nr:unnamed protein product [Dovyalis caffra]
MKIKANVLHLLWKIGFLHKYVVPTSSQKVLELNEELVKVIEQVLDPKGMLFGLLRLRLE